MSPLIGLLLLAATPALASCSAISPYSTQTRLELTLTGNDLLNPDINGRPSPVVVRLLELRNPVGFETQDFFSLYGRGSESLGQDLIAAEELELRPGQSRHLKLRATPAGRFVGVLAAYRDLPETRWRYVIELRARDLTRADLTLSDDGIHRLNHPAGELP